MGMFDEVMVKCPSCEEITLFQSKAGECALRTYSLDNVPIEILGDMASRDHYCNHCGKRLAVTFKYQIVPIVVVK